MKLKHKEFERFLKDNYFCESILSSSRASISLLGILLAWKKIFKNPIIALSSNVCHEVFVSILRANYTPVFVDLDPFTGKVPPSEWERAYERGASVALVVHLYGNPSNTDEVANIFNGKNYLVIDDAAQAIGAKYSNKNCGSMGDVGLLSFGYKKHIQTGGAITLFKDPMFAKEVELQLRKIHKKDYFGNDSSNNNFIADLRRGRKGVYEKNNTNLKFLHDGLMKYNLLHELKNPFDPISTFEELKRLNKKVNVRLNKCSIWRENLDLNKFIPFGLSKNSSPWRYACRIENISWEQQNNISEEIRKYGINVSNWYIPIHWMYKSKEKFNLKGIDKISREIFQFWVDEETSREKIISHSKIINKIVEKI